jgi:hypothetical protein
VNYIYQLICPKTLTIIIEIYDYGKGIILDWGFLGIAEYVGGLD